MTIKVVERGAVIECAGSIPEVLEVLTLIATKVSRVSFVAFQGRAAACWESGEQS
jgi:hypothetical protein